jgi:hypothetical protein
MPSPSKFRYQVGEPFYFYDLTGILLIFNKSGYYSLRKTHLIGVG